MNQQLDPAYARALKADQLTWSGLARANGGEVEEIDGGVIALLGAPTAFPNHVLISQPPADPAGTVAHVVSFIEARGLPFVFEVRDAVQSLVQDALESFGFIVDDSAAFMIAGIDDIPPAQPVDGVRVRRVEPGPDIEAMAIVSAASMGGRPEGFVYYAPETAIASREEFAFIAEMDGVDVANSMCWVADGCAGIYTVGTLEAYRKRGIGAMMTQVAVEAGRTAGCDATFLQASQLGFPIYEKLGFRTMGSYAVYRREGPL